MKKFSLLIIAFVFLSINSSNAQVKLVLNGGEMGISITDTNIPEPSIGSFHATVNRYNSSIDFIWSPIIGIRLNKIDINIKYQNISRKESTTSWFGFNVGYVFGG